MKWLKQIISQQASSQSLYKGNQTQLNRFTVILLLAAICGAIAGNVFVRQNQLFSWQADPNVGALSNYAFSTADAAYFLMHARTIKLNEPIAEVHQLRNYPNLLDVRKHPPGSGNITSRPLLSVIIAYLAKDTSTKELIRAGNILLIVTAGITAVMILVCFASAGYWLEGSIASLGGGLSAAYLVRSSIGRIDTDQLNLGFMYLILGVSIFAAQSKNKWMVISFCALAGILGALFKWWYDKPELIFILSISLFWLLICFHKNFLLAACGIGLFLLLSGFKIFNPFGNVYLDNELSYGTFVYENALATVSEVSAISLKQILISTTGSVEMGLVGISGLALFLLKNPSIGIAYGPLAGFFMLSIIIGNRAVFYSAPMLWFGVAYCISCLSNLTAVKFVDIEKGPASVGFVKTVSLCLCGVICWVNSPTEYVPRPSFPSPVVDGFMGLKTPEAKKQSVVISWWDYGYTSMLLNGLPTMHDGGSHTTPTTHFVARAMLNESQSKSLGILKFLAVEGHRGISNEKALVGLEAQFQKSQFIDSPDLYLVVTSQMAGWMGSISQIGNWNIEAGNPVALRGNPNGPLVNYEQLNCRLAGYPKTLTCSGAAFDLERGLVNGAPVLAGWAHSQNGTVVRNKKFNHDGNLAIQIVQTGHRINVFLIHRQLFESSFNELFYLGQIDHPSISLHYDNYPHIRIYKIDGKPSN